MAEAEDIERCHRCLQPNVKWVCDDDLWDFVMLENTEYNINSTRFDGNVCMTCFVKLAFDRSILSGEWELKHRPDEHVHFPAGWTLNLPPNVVMERFDFVKPFELSLNIEASVFPDVEPPRWTYKRLAKENDV